VLLPAGQVLAVEERLGAQGAQLDAAHDEAVAGQADVPTARWRVPLDRILLPELPGPAVQCLADHPAPLDPQPQPPPVAPRRVGAWLLAVGQLSLRITAHEQRQRPVARLAVLHRELVIPERRGR